LGLLSVTLRGSTTHRCLMSTLSDVNTCLMTMNDWLIEHAQSNAWIVKANEKDPEILRLIEILCHDLQNVADQIEYINRTHSRDWDTER